MNKIISFSLFGADNKYINGAIVNAKEVKMFYPGWVARFYVGKSIQVDVKRELRSLGAQVVTCDLPENNLSTLWRLYAFADNDVDVVLIRDTDSRFSFREVSAVNAWLDSKKDFHIMRDHPYHTERMMAGMWGAKTRALKGFMQIMEQFHKEDLYGVDQFFLRKVIYPRAKKSACIHDSFFRYERNAQPFPSARNGGAFVGEVIDGAGQPDLKARNVLLDVESNALLFYCNKYKYTFRSFLRDLL
jgi:hypothetical protein